jgi:hypothetical protein
MAAHKGPASLRPRFIRGGSPTAAIPIYQSTYENQIYCNLPEKEALNITDATLQEIFIRPLSEAHLQDQQISVELHSHTEVFSPYITPIEKFHLLTPLWLPRNSLPTYHHKAYKTDLFSVILQIIT